jgi:BrnA antitoxin of type II toxin-antitoxin system
MKKEYDFSQGTRGPVLPPQAAKTRITIYLDDAVIDRFRDESERSGQGYQTLINQALRAHLGIATSPLTAEEVRKIVREELAQHPGKSRARAASAR